MTRRGLDTNVLIYAHMAELPLHATVQTFLLDQLSRDDMTLVVTPNILHEFIHIVTDPKRFDPPVSMIDALAMAQGYLGRTNVQCLTVDEASLVSALDLLTRHQLGRRRIADTLFAAALLTHGVSELITCNPDDFQIFEGLTLIDPSAEHPAQ